MTTIIAVAMCSIHICLAPLGIYFISQADEEYGMDGFLFGMVTILGGAAAGAGYVAASTAIVAPMHLSLMIGMASWVALRWINR